MKWRNPPSAQIDNAKVRCLCDGHVLPLQSPVSSVGVSKRHRVCAPYVSVTVEADGVQISSMCGHVCVLICLVSVLITLIIATVRCLFGRLCLACDQSGLSQPLIHLCFHVLVCLLCVCVSLAGMSVSAIKDGSGILVRSVVQGGSVCQDGRLGVGDAILAINREHTSNLTSAQARAMLRRHSVTGPEIR